MIEYARARGEDPELALVRRERAAPARRQLRARRSPPPPHRLHARRGGRRLPRRRPLLALAPRACRSSSRRPTRSSSRPRRRSLPPPPARRPPRRARRERAASSHADALDVCAAPAGRGALRSRLPRSALRRRRHHGGAPRARRRRAARSSAESGPDAYEDRDDPDAWRPCSRPASPPSASAWRPAATLYLHLDHRAVHEVKVACRSRLRARRLPGRDHLVAGQRGARRARLLRDAPDASCSTRAAPRSGARGLQRRATPALREPFAETSLAMHFTQRSTRKGGATASA